MEEWLKPDVPYLAIEIITQDNKSLSMQEVSAFLYDLNLLYEISRLALDREYRHFNFTSFIGSRKARWQLHPSHHLFVQKLHIGSPLEELLLTSLSNGAAKGVSGLLVGCGLAFGVVPRVMKAAGDLFKSIADGRKALADAQKTRAQARLLELKGDAVEEQLERKDNAVESITEKTIPQSNSSEQTLIELPITDRRLIAALKKRGAVRAFDRVVKRLNDADLQVIAINVRQLDSLPPDGSR